MNRPDFPEYIYLQLHPDDAEDEGVPDDTTWCVDHINETDVLYRRVDNV